MLVHACTTKDEPVHSKVGYDHLILQLVNLTSRFPEAAAMDGKFFTGGVCLTFHSFWPTHDG